MPARFLCALLALVFLAVSACERRQAPPANKVAQQAWAAVLAEHTSGIVPRRASLRIRFAIDVAAATPAAPDPQLLTIEPRIAGKLEFSGARELVFTPQPHWQPGQTYRVRLAPRGLTGVAPALAPYEFVFTAQRPQFEVIWQPLEAERRAEDGMTLRGTVVTADVEDAAQIEKILTVEHLGRLLPLRWVHDAAGGRIASRRRECCASKRRAGSSCAGRAMRSVRQRAARRKSTCRRAMHSSSPTHRRSNRTTGDRSSSASPIRWRAIRI
ncbi:MAG: hypothetical protein NZM12_05650 [Steroidobacteraceae bacterium]|nr:hypothetical protein [Steroidobacteraceae bacterium]MDW8260706.1 hypothetical protein [Gammaproteobacteria bacterium]